MSGGGGGQVSFIRQHEKKNRPRKKKRIWKEETGPPFYKKGSPHHRGRGGENGDRKTVLFAMATSGQNVATKKGRKRVTDHGGQVGAGGKIREKKN